MLQAPGAVAAAVGAAPALPVATAVAAMLTSAAVRAKIMRSLRDIGVPSVSLAVAPIRVARSEAAS